MADAITPSASTLEGQLWEIALQIQLAELAIPCATRPNNIQVNVDPEGQTVSVTFSAPASFTVSSAGALVASPTPYL